MTKLKPDDPESSGKYIDFSLVDKTDPNWERKLNKIHDIDHLFPDEEVKEVEEDGKKVSRIFKKEKPPKQLKSHDCAECDGKGTAKELVGMDGSTQCTECGHWKVTDEFAKKHSPKLKPDEIIKDGKVIKKEAS